MANEMEVQTLFIIQSILMNAKGLVIEPQEDAIEDDEQALR